jgi:hypothetical protein
MRGVESNFALSIAVGAAIAVAAVLIAVLLIARGRRQSAIRALSVGSIAAVIAVTVVPGRRGRWVWEGLGDVVYRPGSDTLPQWSVLLTQPGSFEAILWLANVLMYTALAFLGVFAWASPRAAFALAVGVSVFCELLQFAVLSRVASVDDVILNVGGAALGVGVAWAIRRTRAQHDRPV